MLKSKSINGVKVLYARIGSSRFDKKKYKLAPWIRLIPSAEKIPIRHKYKDPRRVAEKYMVDFFELLRHLISKKKLKTNKQIIVITKKEENGPLLT